MKEISLYDARNGLSALVNEVATTGETIVITRHGKPAARLVPVAALDPAGRSERRAALARLLFERLDERALSLPEGVVPPTWDELKAELDDDRP